MPVEPQGPIPAELRRLCRLIGPELASDLLLRLEEDLTAARTGLAEAVSARNLPTVAAQTHVIIALAGTAGDMTLHADACNLNTMAHEAGPYPPLAKLAQRIDAGLGSLLASVREERCKGAPSA